MIRTERVAPTVTLLTLARPEKKNALSLAMIADIQRVLDEAVDLDALVVAGDGAAGVFSAGFDRGDLAKVLAGGGSAEEAAGALHRLLLRLETSPFSVVTAVAGAAIGGGCELALTGDVRVAHPDATFLLPPAKLGIVYPEEGLVRLREALGGSLLRAMLVEAAPVSARTLFSVGAVHELAADPLARALQRAVALSAIPRDARRANRDAALALRGA